MDADLPTPDRVDLDTYEVDDDAIPSAEASIAAGEPDAAVQTDAAVEPAPVTATAPEPPAAPRDDEDDRLDLDAIEADLQGVEVALARLGDGTYWTDEVTGEPLPDELLASSPTARRA